MSITIDRILAASPNTSRGQPTQLSTDAKGERIVYASGKSVFVRSIDNPSQSKQYTAHTAQTTVARFSPSGFYVASGDVSGSVRVWDSIEAVNTKGEYHIISGRINDIAWDGDSQRVIAVGDGRERFGHCITADSGNSVGEISGHSGIINSVSIRQQRPLRAATGSDDTSMVFLNGAPFKFATKVGGIHKGYVYGTAFSPNGDHLVTVGADKRIQLYDGKTGEPTKQIGEGEHTGSIFSVSWSSDSTKFVTASADQTVRVWDVETGKSTKTWKFGGESGISIPDQQVGVVWPAGRKDGLIISLNLAGDLIYLHEDSADPVRIVQGHNRSITAIAINTESSKTPLFTGSFEGRVCSWDLETGNATAIEGQTHTNQVTAFTSTPERTYSVGWDDTLRIIDEPTSTFVGTQLKLTAQPKGISSSISDSKVYVATTQGVETYDKDALLSTTPIKEFSPTAIANTTTHLALGSETGKLHIYGLSSSALSPHKTLEKSPSPITALAFSPDSTLLVAGTAAGKITVYSTADWEVVTDRWSSHTARITGISWHRGGKHAVSASLDTNLHVWSLEKPGKRVKAGNAHKDGVAGVVWVEEGIVSVGGDAAVKVWKVEVV